MDGCGATSITLGTDAALTAITSGVSGAQCEALTLVGQASGLTITLGGTANDTLLLGSCADTVYVSNAETVWGYDGNDTITVLNTAGNGAVYLNGGNGADYLTGGNGADQLVGYTGADTIVGGYGADTITGGAGADVLYGGNGADVFVFGNGESSLTGMDTIADFDTSDILSFHSACAAATTVATPVDVSLASSLIEAANLSSTGDGTNAGGGSITNSFVYGGNTYVVHDVSASTTFVSGVDSLVKITGVVTLAAGNIVFN